MKASDNQPVMSTDTLRPLTKRDISAVWEFTYYRAQWWGDHYMFLRGANPYPDKLDGWFTTAPSHLALRQVIRAFMRPFLVGQCKPVALSDLVVHKAWAGTSFPVLRARAHGRRLRGVLPKSWAAVDPRKSLYIEKRLGEGAWHLSPDRKGFVYAHDGKLLAVVMGIHGVREDTIIRITAPS